MKIAIVDGNGHTGIGERNNGHRYALLLLVT